MKEKKSATSGPQSGLSADFTSWTPAAFGVPMVPEPVLEVEAKEEYFVTRMDEFGRWWSSLGSCATLMAWYGGTSPRQSTMALG